MRDRSTLGLPVGMSDKDCFKLIGAGRPNPLGAVPLIKGVLNCESGDIELSTNRSVGRHTCICFSMFLTAYVMSRASLSSCCLHLPAVDCNLKLCARRITLSSELLFVRLLLSQ